MFILYFLALIPCIIGVFFFFFNKKICWAEWLIGSILALFLASIFHFYSYYSQIGDTETWSGKIIDAYHIPEWKEQYQEAIYRTETYKSGTDSNGNPIYSTRRVFSHYETRYQNHKPKWVLVSNINTSYNVSETFFQNLIVNFGSIEKREGDRRTGKKSSKMVRGDPYDYYGVNINNWIESVNKPVKFKNRLKASRTVFSSFKIEDEHKTLLFDYPYSDKKSPFTSNRLLGVASKYIDPLEWEQLNGELGPIKKINLICVGFDDNDSLIAEKQIAYWLGGKKNDLIIIFGNGWSKVYGWSESELCKTNIETLFLNPSNEELLEKLKKEISINYEKVNFTEKFSYIQIQPTTKHVIIYLVLLVITQIGLYAIFHQYNIIKEFFL